MYFYLHNNTWNCLGVEKTEVLVYIYTNSRLLCQRPSTNPVRYYDDNVFLEDFDDDGRALSNTDEDNNDDNSGEGHNGDDGNTSNGGQEHCRALPPINHGNVHQECPFDWNENDDKVANGVDKHEHACQ
jgi:hypothetical protein